MKQFLLLVSLSFIVIRCDSQTKPTGTKSSSTTTESQSKGVENLPPPHATRSVMNFSKVEGWGNNATPIAPEGFTVKRFGKNYKNPRWIYELPNGDVLVAETKHEPKGPAKVLKAVAGKKFDQGQSTGGNRIILLRDKNNDGEPEIQNVFIDSLYMPFGMVLLKDYLYVACTDAVIRYPYKDGQTEITANGEKIIELPEGARHWTKNIIANKKGDKLYIAIGSASNVGEDGMDKENRRACILEIDPDGSGEKLFASGLRNPVGMDWEPGTDKLWTVVNERDELGDDLVPDYMTEVKPGGFYGWPYSYFGSHLDPQVKEQKPDLVSKAIVPDVDLGSHTASLGLFFYTKNQFPEKYNGGAFIGQHGSWNRKIPSGYKVVFVPFYNGKPGKPEDFLTGFMIDEQKNTVHGRPVGVIGLHDGSMLVADDAGNMVWRVSYKK